IGPIAFSPDGGAVYFASPNDTGMVDLWTMTRTTGQARRLTAFARDTYAPSVAADGTVVFKTPAYRTHLAQLENEATRQLTAFQPGRPFGPPRQPLLSMTFGSWRRLLDDAKYPDIAQEIGVIDASRPEVADAPATIVASSPSEDQAMAWSPNGAWIALHSHRE